MKDATASNAARPKRRVKKKASTNMNMNNPYSKQSSRKSSVEIGLVFSLLILGLYWFGFFESVRSLPPIKVPLVDRRHLGGNLNPATATIDTPNDGSGGGIVHVPLDNNNAADKTTTTTATGVLKRTEASSFTVPDQTWPVSVRNENNFQDIIHPGDNKTQMSVPAFWSPPIHNNGLMTKEAALKIGSCSKPDANGNYNRGEDCPPDDRTIYFAIASYRDFQCRLTVESAFSRAKNPNRIRVGVVDQIVDGEDVPCDQPIEPCDKNPKQALCMYKDQVDVYQMEAELSIGPVFARHIGHRMYRGEYYYTQSDAHVTYVVGWDEDIVGQFESLNNEMAVLTTYLTDVQGSIGKNGESLRKTRPIMCNTDYEGGPAGNQHLRHGSQPERMPAVAGEPQAQPYWAAGYSFSRGHFVVNVPYDMYQPMVFQGEEMSIGIRGFTVGYDMYAPSRSACFHHYAVGENAKTRNKVPHFWENAREYKGIGKKAMQRLLGIVRMNPEVPVGEWDHREEDVYGLGGVRTPEKFYETFGIDVIQKKTEHHLCSFVDQGAKMHLMFTPFLRPDGMGIDYSQITYRFKDPRPGQK
uniref:Uncharacterized protein n=1 Tax=Grammatophora oceanica TaxID=210454 RepID=A0A7S1V0K9_9STRA|mmetsp:Transcript_32608/g.48319  ORF Transcript_32608/g.48319 Transcript_32608/m.48319 type:complete len:582 (+) Transcript_32608:200-1945(+)|eukprot:CAMPEP_0194052560 /NCGR_PEP_ID=MMETSP0009_2-20130614/45986_1 /TAXON_ID=210454 /ORGANISM="Grammatophora oceanica, Strain CCMP 410" /LENGTH=581 /DNA_ID=CAMNT_0038700193 /DNA_START=180 /DNA_END=1925 /DNA_ORIENTATION=+